MNAMSEKRQNLIQALLPGGVPRLWCPLLTHYRSDGGIDFERMSAHFRHIVPWVKGFLIPGSTGDAWELDEQETMQVVSFALQQAEQQEISLLLGALKRDTEIMKRTISDMLTLVQQNNPFCGSDTVQMLKSKRVCGFTVCPPAGKTLSQADMETGLSQILDLRLPTALYQLPQVTENEVSPETFGRLLGKYFNLIFFKDSSGQDRIATSAVDKGGVFLVRGAEGDYAKWLRETGGPYAGFLLSTANCFARELSSLIGSLERGDQKKAAEISARLTSVITEVFALVQPLPCGNAFTNANKAIDHFFAFGPAAGSKEGPMLHAGVRIPGDIITATGAVLRRRQLMPDKGYLA
jgi:dihydrodipicolinate synthase/N-acetylneuraminate lyase